MRYESRKRRWGTKGEGLGSEGEHKGVKANAGERERDLDEGRTRNEVARRECESKGKDCTSGSETRLGGVRTRYLESRLGAP